MNRNLNTDTSACNPSQIDAFLSDLLNADEERELVVHLDHCDACRSRLKLSAAEDQTWSESSDFLKNDAYDSELQQTSDASDDLRVINHAPINQVLDVLAPTDDPEMLGRLGSYEVSGVIGAGGMGVVLKGHDRSLDRIVAIKVLAPHLATSGAARKRFAREAKAAAAVLHPNVVAIHGVWNDTGLPYLVMPYVRGCSLQLRIDEQGPLETNEILRIGQQVAAGLAAAHEQGLVHRDIKPANVLLTDGTERVAITDFGLARAVDDATMTRSGVLAGTPQYMSPEQARGMAIDARSDLFSLGSLLYATCTGHAPFRAETSYGVLRRITDDTPRDIQQVNAAIPEWLCRLIEGLLEKDVEKRFQSATEVERLLQQCTAHVEQPATSPLPSCLLVPRRRANLVKLSIFAGVGLLACGLLASVAVWMQSTPRDAKPNQQQAVTATTQASKAETTTVQTPGPSEDKFRWNDGSAEFLKEFDRQLNQLDKATQRPFADTPSH